jgi:DNA-directed RNA polymerase subunit RPC12/RpoP
MSNGTLPSRCPHCGAGSYYPTPSRNRHIEQQDGSVKEYMSFRCRRCGRQFDEKMIEEISEKKAASNPIRADMTREERIKALASLFPKKAVAK